MSLTDRSRPDPFTHDNRHRSIMVSGFFPVYDCGAKSFIPYMPPGTGFFMDEKFSVYGLPNGIFRNLKIETCKEIPKNTRCPSGALPIVLFSGALGTSRHLYNAMLQNVAASGYLVVSIDHPYDADIVEFTDGTIIYGTDISSDSEVELALNTRVSDIRFVYQQLQNHSIAEKLFVGNRHGGKISTVAVFGHSLGGAAAAASISNSSIFLGGVNLDGTIFGPVLKSGLTHPFMLVGHENKTRETDPSWAEIWPRLAGWKREYEVQKTAHYSFSDLPLIAFVLGIQSRLPAKVQEIIGTVDGERIMKLTIAYVTAFLDMVLKSHTDKGFQKLDREFPEVALVH